MNLGLKGKVALVTGGARDVGGAIVRALAAEGAAVAINYLSARDAAEALAAEIEGAGGTARAYRADVSDYAAVHAMTGKVVEEFGRLDILVNNAGYVRRQRFEETEPEDWRRQIDVGLYGVIHCIHAALPHLVAAGGGRIVNLAGDSARVGEAGLAVTAAARGGVLALSKSLAKELGRHWITVNAVALGLIETSHSDKSWLDSNRDRILRNYPLRRLGQPGDVGPMVAFLASDTAAWVTGQVISVSGGYSTAG